MDEADLPALLWHLHFLACFLGLAYLPFSKMFHIFTGPLSLMVDAVMEHDLHAGQLATKQIIDWTPASIAGLAPEVLGRVLRESNENIAVRKNIFAESLAAGKTLSS